MADSLSDFIRRSYQDQQKASVGAAEIVLGSVEDAPDQTASFLNLGNEFAKTTGGPVPPLSMVKEYSGVFQQKVEEAKNRTILASSPNLTEWLRDPANAALAKDDLGNLSWFDGFGRGTSNTLARSGVRLGQVYNQFMLNQTAGRAQDRRMSFGEILDSERETIKTPEGDAKTWVNLGDVVSATGRWIDARYADLIGTDDEAAAREYADRLNTTVEQFKAIPKSEIATEFERQAMVEGATLGQTLQNFGSAFLSNPLGGLSWAFETMGESAPQLAAAVAAGAITRNPAVGIGVGTAGSYGTERYIAPAEFLAEKGINLADANDVGRVLSDPEILKEANERGVIRGTVIAAFDALSFGIAGRTIARNPVVEALAQSVSQAINGSLGEYSARLAAGQEIDWNEIIAEGLAEMATTPIDLGIAGRRLHRDRQKAKAAEGTAAQLGEISAQAAQSKLRARTPDKFREYVAAATANGPVENVFIPADQFVQYFQGVGVDPYELIDDLDGVTRDDLDAALAGGGDLQIPTATYAAKIAGSEYDAFLMENMRFDPDEMTAAEAREFNEKAEDALQEAWELAEAIRVEQELMSSIEEQIYDSMVSRLRVAGRSTDVATTEAMLYPAFYRVMAERSGMTTEEFLGRYPLPEIRGDLPEGMQFRDVDELNRTLAEARNRRAVGATKRGPTLLEFISDYGGINDPGGELRARDAAVIRRGKGKKTLKLERSGVMAGVKDMFGAGSGKKYGVDDVALAAIEAGFMADDPDVIAYRAAMEEGRETPDITRALWDAIDRELRGEAQFAGPADLDAEAQERSLDEIEEYLSSLGVSLEDDDATIRQAIEGARQYAQETDRNLIVQHNLTAANLLHADKMRGLAVPSVAISNVDYPLDGFGEITLLGGPDLIDPRKDSSAKVFDADVYSPRYPTVRYKIATKEMNKVWKRLGGVSEELGHVLSGELDNSEVERKGLEAFRDSSAVQLQFLRDTGRGIELPQERARSNYLSKVPELAELVGEYSTYWEVRENAEALAAVKKAVDLEIAQIREAAPDLTVEELQRSYYDREGDIKRSVIDSIQNEIRIAKRPGVDRYASRNAIRDAIAPHANEFAAWVEEQFGSVLAGESIMTETASGDWKYLPHTLDNVVKVLKKKLRDGEGFNYGVGSIRSTVANQFKSVSAIQKARGRLIPADAMKALKDEVDNEFVALAGLMGEYSDFSDGFGWLDTFSEHMKEVAERGVRALRPYYKNLPPEMEQEVAAFLDKLANMPTEYFEAKLQRAVDLSEFKAAVIPNDAPQAAKDVLKYARVPTFEYDKSAPGSRAAAIRMASGQQNLLFQGAASTESDAFKRWFGDSKVVDENGEPLVVYHGTSAPSIDQFRPEKIGSGNDEGFYGAGYYFTTDRELADAYIPPRSSGRVHEVYLSIKNPFVWDLSTPEAEADTIARARSVMPDVQVTTTGVLKRQRSAWTDALKAAGHDGLISPSADEIVAFEPTQIKSVNNRGTFDPSDARLLFQNMNGPRGSIQFPAGGVGNGDTVIRLFQSADLSTMLHESGHYFLTVMRDMASNGGEIAQDFDAVKAWWRSNAQAVAKDAMRAAPNVKPATLNQAAVESDAFKRWFGDSKVVDENGEPLVVYHGTQGDFDAFKDGFAWVTPDRRLAEDYTEMGGFNGRPVGKPRLIEAYARVERPFNSDLGLPSVLTFRELAVGAMEQAAEAGRLTPDIADNVQSLITEVENQNPDKQEKHQFWNGGWAQYTRRLMETLDFDGIEFIEDGSPTIAVLASLQVKDVNNRGKFDPNDARILYQGESNAPRGGSPVVITADDVIRAIDEGTSGDSLKDMLIDIGMQEQFARAFEAYLMEGKAPSVELRTAFEKFRAWLISIYQKVAGLNVNVSDDIRRVFDRMLATDEEIAKAQGEIGGNAPVFSTAEAMGLTDEEYANFLKLRAQAEDDAKARLLRETMAPIKREREKWFKDERAKVREEVEREVNAYRFFRAIEWMGNRRWLGDGQPEDMPDIRLSKDILVERYGEGVLKTLPRGKQTVYAVEGGIDPDDAAGWFGFDSGDELIQAMEKAPKRLEAIEAETDRIMYERHGDALKDGSIEAEALDAVHTDKRGQWIAAELKAVVEIAGTGTGMTAKEARASAKATIARMRVRDAMSAGRFLAAERKAADEAARLGAMLAREGIWMRNARRRIAGKAREAMRGDGAVEAVAPQIERANSSTGNYNETVARLIDAKRRQLLNHALYMEARKVADEVEAAERYVAKLNKKSTRERIGGAGRRENAQVDYLAAIDDILERYDFRRMSGAAEARRGSLAAFVEAMKAAGRENEIAIPDHVLADAVRRPYKTLPVEELRGVIDSLKNLEHIATRWNKLIDAQNERMLDDAVNEIVGAFEANVKKRPPGRVNTTREALRNTGRQFLDLVLNAGTILREIDGFADLGAAYRNIKSPIDEAMTRLIVRKEKAARDLDSLYSVYSKDERRRMAVREYMPELGFSLSKWEKIAVALNAGNAGNLQRMTDPRVRGSLTEPQVQAVLATLDERDADFVQSVWDYVGSFRDDIAAREKRATGIEPAWVEPTPVVIGGKTLKGGYYPLKYDPRLSTLTRDDETADLAATLQAGRFGKAQTRNGHLKARAQASGRAVELDMSVLHRHVNQVIYDLELSEPVANSWRILQNGKVRSAFMDAGKQADFDALEIWLQDVGTGELRSGDLVGRGARTLKSNFTAAKLAFNFGTVAVQVTGLSQSMVVVGKKNMAVGVMKAAANPVATANEVAAKSPFMASRQTTFNKDIYDFYNDPKTGPIASRWGEIKSEIIGPLSFWLMTKVQWYLVDVPTWLAGYRQGLARFGNDEAKAVAHADAIVKRAQASGLFSDRSAIERGSLNRTARQNDVVRLFTALGSYMFAKFNVAYERSARAGRSIQDQGVSLRSAQEALSWTLDMAFLFTLEAVVIAAIKGKLPDDEDDEDEDGWLAFLAKETAFSAMATVPFVRDVSGPLQGFDGGGAYGAITKEIAAPFIQAKQGEVDPALVKSVINATGLATGLPSTQINRAVDAGWRQAEGEDVSPLEYLLGRSGK